jgi:hypothetical protein
MIFIDEFNQQSEPGNAARHYRRAGNRPLKMIAF